MKSSLRVYLLPFIACAPSSRRKRRTRPMFAAESASTLCTCSIQDLSDKARCMIAHPDKPPVDGGMIYSYDTRQPE